MIKLKKIFEDLKKENKFKKEDIQKLLGDPNHPTQKSDYANLKVLLRIYDFQTEDEKNAETTEVHNTVGFSGVDGQILTSFGNNFLKYKNLRPKQMAIVRKKMKKYAGQIAKLLNKEMIDKKNFKYQPVLDAWKINSRNQYDNNGVIKPEFYSGDKMDLLGKITGQQIINFK